MLSEYKAHVCREAIVLIIQRNRRQLLFRSVIYYMDGRGSIVVRAHASRAEGLWFESDSMP